MIGFLLTDRPTVVWNARVGREFLNFEISAAN